MFAGLIGPSRGPRVWDAWSNTSFYKSLLWMSKFSKRKEGLIKGLTTTRALSSRMQCQPFSHSQGYDSFTPVTRVIDGGEPMEFRCLFKNWKEKDQTTSFTNKRRISGKNDSFLLYETLFRFLWHFYFHVLILVSYCHCHLRMIPNIN